MGDLCDNCPETFNPLQEDINHNLIGKICTVTSITFNHLLEDINHNLMGMICTVTSITINHLLEDINHNLIGNNPDPAIAFSRIRINKKSGIRILDPTKF